MWQEMRYPVNYGYVSGLLGGDEAEQDIYLLRVKSVEQEFMGKVIAVYHWYDDNETKWIVVPCDDEGIVYYFPDLCEAVFHHRKLESGTV